MISRAHEELWGWDDPIIFTEVYSLKSNKEGQEDHGRVEELGGSPLAVLRSPPVRLFFLVGFL